MYGVNGSSDAISRDMNAILYSSTFKHPADGEFAKIKQLISFDDQNQSQNRNQQQEDETQRESRGSLLRYRSTPSSFFSNLLNDNGGDEFSDPVTDASNNEPEERFFMTHQQQEQKEGESESDVREFLEYTPSSVMMKQERRESAVQKQDLPPPSAAAMNASRRVPNLPPFGNSSGFGYTNQSNLDSASSFRGMDSTSSNLVRQSSTPAGFLSSLTIDNGPSSSSSRFLPQIAENENGLQESAYGSLKRSRDGVLNISQNGEAGSNTPNLVHHMSLPKTSSEMANVESFLHFQQESTVPWKTRAKRGFATHPRSIAERERRTRISERIKRLQDLFPDIDKQTNTADMLDMAVEYIKNLQSELQNLNEARARCRCSSKQLQSGSSR